MAEPAVNMFDTHKSIRALVDIGIKAKQAEGIVELVSKSREYDFSRLATKDQVEAVKTELYSVKTELKAEIDGVRKDVKAEIAIIKSEIANLQFNILKWIIPFFLTNSLALVAVIIALFFRG